MSIKKIINNFVIMVLKNLLKYQNGGLTPDKIQNIINKYGKGKSPFTANDYIQVSKNTGVPVDLLLAQGIQESNLGTQGRAVRTRNVGNVGNTDNGAENHQDSWLNGLYRQANLLKNEYKVSSASDVQRLISNDFLRPIKGGKYTSAENYGSKVGNLINSLYGKNVYTTTKNKSTIQTENNQANYAYQPLPYIENTLPGQVQTNQIDFWTLPSETQNTIIENQKLQQELISQQVESDKAEQENFAIEQRLKQKQLERQQLLSSIPQAQYIGNNSNLQPNPFTTLLQSDTQYMQQGGTLKITSNPGVNEINGIKVDEGDIKDYYNQVIGSKWYKDRLLKNQYLANKVNNIIDLRSKNINTTNAEYGFSDEYGGTGYYRDESTLRKGIYVNPNDLKELNANPMLALAHEYGHSELDSHSAREFKSNVDPGLNDFETNIFNRNKANPVTDMGSYVLDPEEAKGDVNAIRYNLYKSGLFNPQTGKFKTDSGQIDSRIINTIKQDTTVKRMLDAYGEDGLIDIINNIAINNQKYKNYI